MSEFPGTAGGLLFRFTYRGVRLFALLIPLVFPLSLGAVSPDDTVKLYVLRPVITLDRSKPLESADIDPLDKFGEHFRYRFRKKLIDESHGRTPELNVIDVDNEEEARVNALRSGYTGKFALATMYFCGEITKGKDAYVLRLSLKLHDNTIPQEEMANIRFSEVDDFERAEEIAIEMVDYFINRICKSKCDPQTLPAGSKSRNSFYRKLRGLMNLLSQYDPESEDADQVDYRIAKIKKKLGAPPEEFTLSYYVTMGFFYKTRLNPRKAGDNFSKAQRFYCLGKTSEADLRLVKQFCGNFPDFDIFIKDQIKQCKR